MRTHRDKPQLVWYSNDGTPSKIKARLGINYKNVKCTRFGHKGVEFIVQWCNVLVRSRQGVFQTSRPGIPYVLPPKHNGRDIFGVAKGFIPAFRNAGARAAVLFVVCLDSKFFETVSRQLEQYVALEYIEPRCTRWDPGLMPCTYYELLDWFLPMPCMLHVWNNAICWATWPHQDKETLKRLFVVLESLRASIETFGVAVHGWVTRKAQLAPRRASRDTQESVGSAVIVSNQIISYFFSGPAG